MSNPFGQARAQGFHEHIEGTWGEFATVSGRVTYLMTNARLGAGGTDWERRLTSRLRPVREVLHVPDMNFDQLLQRDLDDHRVATELIPYLLRGGDSPAFFPSILAVLLPFENGETSTFPVGAGTANVDADGMPFREDIYEDSFRFRRLVETGSEELHSIRFGHLAWNEERSKIVVIDGQHRAMALLALDRTLNGSWSDDARGARYRHFYEDRVQAIVNSLDTDTVNMLQVPVTICWFPDLVGQDSSPHVAARSLFVDVNREAKQPSRDRVVLLSDDDLLNVLTRSVLNQMRNQASDPPPLHAIEYDNPGAGARHARWSTISSLQSIRNMVARMVFGPKKYAENVSVAIRGRESGAERDAFMREQLRLAELFRHELPDGSGREDLSRLAFPREVLDDLRQEFDRGWGAALIVILGSLSPMDAHCRALADLEQTWLPADPSTVDALAREAVFEGVGMYWTLRESYDHWRSTTPVDERQHPPDVVQAWNRLLSKSDEFKQLRAEAYLGRSGSDAVAESEDAFAVLETHACQVGLGLLLTAVAAAANVDGSGVATLARDLVEALNVGLHSTTSGGHDRRLFMSQTVQKPLNRIGDMNTTRAVEFRYLWLELLCVEEALAAITSLQPGVSPEMIEELRGKARARYVQQLIDERIAERRRYDRSRSRSDLLSPVTLEVTASVQSALKEWFDVSDEDFQLWASSADFTVGGDEPEDGDGESDDG